MIVRPKRYLTDPDKIRFNYGDFLSIECEVVNPPSARGRTVSVFLDDDDVTILLLELRARAIRARNNPEKRSRWERPDPWSVLDFKLDDH